MRPAPPIAQLEGAAQRPRLPGASRRLALLASVSAACLVVALAPVRAQTVVVGAGETVPGLTLQDGHSLLIDNRGTIGSVTASAPSVSVINWAASDLGYLMVRLPLDGARADRVTLVNEGTIRSASSDGVWGAEFGGRDNYLFSVFVGNDPTGTHTAGFQDIAITNLRTGLIEGAVVARPLNASESRSQRVTLLNEGTIRGFVDLERATFHNRATGEITASNTSMNNFQSAVRIMGTTGPIINEGLIRGDGAEIGRGTHGLAVSSVSSVVVQNLSGLAKVAAGQTPNLDRGWDGLRGILSSQTALSLVLSRSATPGVASAGTVENGDNGLIYGYSTIPEQYNRANPHSLTADVEGGANATITNRGVIIRPGNRFAAIFAREFGTNPDHANFGTTIVNHASGRIGTSSTTAAGIDETAIGIRVESGRVVLDNAGVIRASNYGVLYAPTPVDPTGQSWASNQNSYLRFTLRSGSLTVGRDGAAIGMQAVADDPFYTMAGRDPVGIAGTQLYSNGLLLYSNGLLLSGNSVVEQGALAEGRSGIMVSSLMGHTVTNHGTIRTTSTGSVNDFWQGVGFFETGLQGSSGNLVTLAPGVLINENTGTISATRNSAVRMAGGTFINRGTISTTNTSTSTTLSAFYGTNESQRPQGLDTIFPQFSQTAAFYAPTMATIENTGSISSPGYGIWVGQTGAAGLTGMISNSGTVSANAFNGILVGAFATGAVVRNTGSVSISDIGGIGIEVYGATDAQIATGKALILENSGTITGHSGVYFWQNAIIRGVGTDAQGNPNRLTGRIEGRVFVGIQVTDRLVADLNTNATIIGGGARPGLLISRADGVVIRNGGTIRGGLSGLQVSSGAPTVVNERGGVIEATGTLSTHSGARLPGLATLTNAGTIAGIATAASAIRLTGTVTSGSGAIVNEASGVIRSGGGSAGTAIVSVAANDVTIRNLGLIDGGVQLGSGNDTYVLAQGATQTGAVAGGAGTGDLFQFEISSGSSRSFGPASGTGILPITQFETIRQTGNGLLVSNGTLNSAVTLIDVQGGTFRNDGTIAAATGRELRLSGDGTRLDNRAGARIDAPIVASAGELRQTVTNDGIITGSISLGAGDDLVSNRGAISGGIDLGTGNDAYVWWIAGSSNGTAGAAINGGDGIDAVLWGVDAGLTVTLGSFDDRRSVIQNMEAVGKAGAGTLILDFDIAQANNVQGLRVAEGTLILAEGRSFTIVRGSEAGGGYVDLTGIGAVLENRGTLFAEDRLEMRADQTRLINSRTGMITVGADGTGSLTGDAGRQTIENSGTIRANVDLGAGDDLIINSGVFIGQVNLGAGNDEFRWNPLAPPASATARIDGGPGADAIMVHVTQAAAPDGFTLNSLPTIPGLTSFEAIGKSGDGTLTLDFAGQSQIDTEGLRVSGGTLILRTPLNANLTANAGSGYIDLNGVGAVLDNRASLLFAGDRFEMSADNTTLINAPGSTIRVRADGSGTILGGLGSQTVTNAGTIFANVSLGAGNDRYFLANSGQQFGLVSGGPGEDTAAFEVIANNTRTIAGANYVDFEVMEKSGGGTLRITPGALTAARVVILGGRVENLTSVHVTNQVNLEASDITWANAPGSAVAAMQGSTVAIRATQERVAVENGGAVSGEVRFTGRDNTYMLTTTGTQTGLVHGGNAAANNRLHYDAPSTGRDLTPTSFVNFERVELNVATHATGRIVVAAASNPTSQATLDTGGTANSSVTHHRGTLVLQDEGSSLRAHTVTLEPGTRLEGNGTIFSTPASGGNLGMTYARGTVAPGNSIGTLVFDSNYTPTGPFEVQYRPPPVGLARGRNVIEGSTPTEQDADLIRVSGTAALGGASIVPLRLGTAAQMNTALAASPSGELRWLVLRATGGLGGTRFVALSNTAEVRVEYPANGTDVELVVASPVVDPPAGGGSNTSGGGGGNTSGGGGSSTSAGGGGDPPSGSNDPRPNIVVVTQPPTALTRRDQVLYQQAVSGTAALFDLASDCYRPEGLATALRDEQMCFFAQGRLLQGRFDGVDSYALFQAKGDPFDAFSPATGALRLRGADAAIGVVGRIGEEGWLGFALGFGEGDFSTAPVAGSQFRTRYSGLQLAALARWAYGPLELRGMLGYGFQEIDGQRPSALAGGEDRLSTSTNQRYATFAGETRYWLGTRGALALAPTIRLHYTDLHRDAYAEAGRSADALRADATSAESLRLLLGLTGEIGLHVGERPVILEPRLGWQQELGDRRIETSGEFLGAPGQPVRGSGSTLPRDSAVLGLAAITEISPGTRLRFGYDASLANNAYTQAVTLRLSYAW